jgi:NAD-dependent dihydropyrimidine dehydrogenase PreA subunit
LATVTKQSIVGPTVILEPELCKGCSLCVNICPQDVLHLAEMLNRQGFHPAAYTGEGCTGCGVCFYACPEPGAIIVYKPPRKSRA